MGIALEVMPDEHEMIRAAHSGFGVAAILAVAPVRFFPAVMAAALSNVDFAADDGLDVALAGFIEEIGGGEEIAMVGDGHGGHLLAGRLIQKLGGFSGPIQQAVIGVNGKMNEMRLPHGTPF